MPEEPAAKRQRVSDFVLQPEEEFLAAHPGPAKIMVQVRELHHPLLHNFLLFLLYICLMHIVPHPLAPPRSWCRCAKKAGIVSVHPIRSNQAKVSPRAKPRSWCTATPVPSKQPNIQQPNLSRHAALCSFK